MPCFVFSGDKFIRVARGQVGAGFSVRGNTPDVG
jgi:hypothetical protein